jgi:hypothetical protein
MPSPKKQKQLAVEEGARAVLSTLGSSVRVLSKTGIVDEAFSGRIVEGSTLG